MSYRLSAEIKEARKYLESVGRQEAIAKLQKRVLKAKPDKAERLQQVIDLMVSGQPFPEPHPLRAEVRQAEKLLETKPPAEVVKILQQRVADRQFQPSLEHLLSPGSFWLRY